MQASTQKNTVTREERERLEILYTYKTLLDLPSDAFNATAEVVAVALQVPSVAVTIIDEDTVYIKANVGVPPEITQLPRSISLSDHTLRNKRLTVFEDTQKESCLTDHPFVTGNDPVLFYAGAPLLTSQGYCLGSLCISDQKARTFSDHDRMVLSKFAALIMHEIELQKNAFIQKEFSSVVQEARRDATWDWNLLTDELTWDRGFTTLFGYDQHTFSGIEDWLEKIHPDDEERMRTGSRIAALAEKKEWAEEYRFRKADGSYVYVLDRGRTIENEKGELYRMIGTMIDIDDQVKMRNDLIRKTKSLELLNEIGKSLSKELNLQNVLQRVTDITTELSGAAFGAFFYNSYNEEGEIYQLYTLSGVPAEAFKGFPMPRNTPVFHTTFSGEAVLRSDDITKDPRYGKWAPHHGMPKGHLPVRSYLAVPVKGQQGNVMGGLFFGHSQTGMFTAEHEDLVSAVASQASVAIENTNLFDKLKALNDNNRSLLEMAKRSNEQKDEFLSVASHELKTPLTGIKAYNQMLSQNFKDAKLLEKQQRSIRKMERLINDLLDVSKISAGHMQFNREDIDLTEIIDSSIEALVQQNISHEIEYEPFNDGLMIHADRIRIEQVVYNILNNAVKYSPGKNKILIKARPVGKFAVLEITDFGIGIEEEYLKKIFERFYRIDMRQAHVSGLGLGLYISMQIIKAHNGTIWTESNPGEGSTFSIAVPLAGKETDEPASPVDMQVTAPGTLSVEWSGLLDYADVEKGGAMIVDAIQKHNIRKILNDNRKVIGNWSEASDTGRDVWFPLLASLGIVRFAWIRSRSTFSNLSADASVATEVNQLQIKFFYDEKEAAEWLNE